MWPPPAPGDIVWCRFPERPRDKPGPKPRPGLVVTVIEREDGVAVRVAHGTSQGLTRLASGEFAIRRDANPAAYELAGLSYDTKFDLRKVIELPWDEAFFGVPADARHGQNPKLGTLHPSMMKAVLAAADRKR
jgi:hypothetical protein